MAFRWVVVACSLIAANVAAALAGRTALLSSRLMPIDADGD
jgi:hypothetical protein